MAEKAHTTKPANVASPAGVDLSCLPSPYDIGRRIKMLRDEHNRLDNAILGLPKTLPAWEKSGEHDLQDADQLALDREDALRDLITTIPAHDLRDAAMQLHVAWSCTHWLADKDLFERESRRLDRILLSVIPLIAAAAGIDLKEIGGEQVETFAARAFAASIEEAGA